MNILFFLTPKAMCAYIEAGDTLRQAMERMDIPATRRCP